MAIVDYWTICRVADAMCVPADWVYLTQTEYVLAQAAAARATDRLWDIIEARAGGQGA